MCFIVLSWWQKTHDLLLCQLYLTRLSLVRITPRRRYHVNTSIFSEIFIFQIFLLLLLSTGISGWIKALYIEVAENKPFLVRCQWKTSDPCFKWNESRHCNKFLFRTNETSSEWHIFWGSHRHLSECITLVSHNIVHCRILFMESFIGKTLIMLEPNLRSIPNAERSV
jgi:hypothetical protein